MSGDLVKEAREAATMDGPHRWSSFLERLADRIELVEKERDERANSQTHAEALLGNISAFLTGWTFANLDTECGDEAEALDSEITTLFAYGWPQAQYPVGLSSAPGAQDNEGKGP
jgi:hypothetical protein